MAGAYIRGPAVQVIELDDESLGLMRRYAEKFEYDFVELEQDPDQDTFFPACSTKSYGVWVIAPAYDGTDRFVLRKASGGDDVFLTSEEFAAMIERGEDLADDMDE